MSPASELRTGFPVSFRRAGQAERRNGRCRCMSDEVRLCLPSRSGILLQWGRSTKVRDGGVDMADVLFDKALVKVLLRD